MLVTSRRANVFSFLVMLRWVLGRLHNGDHCTMRRLCSPGSNAFCGRIDTRGSRRGRRRSFESAIRRCRHIPPSVPTLLSFPSASTEPGSPTGPYAGPCWRLLNKSKACCGRRLSWTTPFNARIMAKGYGFCQTFLPRLTPIAPFCMPS